MENAADPRYPQRNVFYFDYELEENQVCQIKFNSVFDSGNMRQVECPDKNTYIIHTAPDCCGTQYESFTRSWYYFGVQGVPKEVTINFVIKRIHILYSMFKNAAESYKPVFRIGKGSWRRVEGTTVVSVNAEDKGLDVKFSFTFDQDEEVFFAFTYPFSCEENQKMLDEYDKLFTKDREIYYHHDIIIRSPQDRPIDLLTITSPEGKLVETESFIEENLFPNKQTQSRARKFRTNKPVILITARVHPGEAPASHTMNGILKFLLDKKDVRAKLLRSYFVFMLVPILNPDGVVNGHYRMDVFNQNLNRYYKNPDVKKQPAIFAMRELVKYLKSEDRLFFYCDLHAHAAKKGCFLYGNALEYVMQAESILFAKVLSLNCVNFEFASCNFSQKQMSSRDRGEKLTKEGSGRVCVYRVANLIHSYTMECGFHFSNELNSLMKPSNSDKCCESDISDIDSTLYQDRPAYYTIETYEDLGKSMLVSILDIFEKNPCTRISGNTRETLEILRTEIAARIMKIPRFWKEANIKRKFQKIHEIIRETFYDQFEKNKVFNLKFSFKFSNTPRKIPAISSSLNSPASSLRSSSIEVSNKIKESLRSPIVEVAKITTNKTEDTLGDENNKDTSIALPQLKNSFGGKEMTLKQYNLGFQSSPKSNYEEIFSAELEKIQWLLNLKMSNGGVLAIDDPLTNRAYQSPNQVNFAFKHERIKSFSLSTNLEVSRHLRRNSPRKEVKMVGGVEKKKALPSTRLPELDRTKKVEPLSNNTSMLSGGRNYAQIRQNYKMLVENSVRKAN